MRVERRDSDIASQSTQRSSAAGLVYGGRYYSAMVPVRAPCSSPWAPDGGGRAGRRPRRRSHLFFDGAPLARTWKHKDLPGRADAPGRFDPRTPAARAALETVDRRQRGHIRAIERHLGRSVEVLALYRAARNGAAQMLTPEEAARVAELPGVRSVQPDRVVQAPTDRTPWFLGADEAWDGIGVPSGAGRIVDFARERDQLGEKLAREHAQRGAT